MPTGYTAAVVEGKADFRQFALNCMRAFGAMIEFRDDPISEVTTEIPKPTYHDEQLIGAIAEFNLFTGLSEEEKLAWATQHINSQQGRASRYAAKEKEENARLKAVAEQVSAWNPPTDDHREYKNFMLQQIKISMNDETYSEKSIATADALQAEDVIKQHIAALADSVSYHTKGAKEDAKRWAERTAWIKAIVDSLTPAPSSPALAAPASPESIPQDSQASTNTLA
jgi:hypothetical protein